jgi:hypothetical protein
VSANVRWALGSNARMAAMRRSLGAGRVMVFRG